MIFKISSFSITLNQRFSYKKLVAAWAATLSLLALLSLPTSVEAAKVVVTVKVHFQFGIISAENSSGTSVIGISNNANTVTGGVVDIGGTTKRAKFKIRGNQGREVTISLPSSVTLSNGTQTMTLTNLVHDCPDPCMIATATTTKANVFVFVGGTLNVSANQAAGNYTGSFDLISDYATNPKGGAGTADSSTVTVANMQALSVSGSGTIDFGTFYPHSSGTAGYAVVAPNGSWSNPDGKVTLIGGSPNAASFTVSGAANSVYSVSIANSTLSNGNGGTMIIKSFTNDNTDGALPASGTETLNVGASLKVLRNQPDGFYTGTFTVEVNYN